MVCDWLPDCWRIDSSPTSAAVGDRNRWDNAPFLKRPVGKKWFCTGACLCATSTCWLYVCTDMLFVQKGVMLFCALIICYHLTHHEKPSVGVGGQIWKVKNSYETQIMDLDVDDEVFFKQVFALLCNLVILITEESDLWLWLGSIVHNLMWHLFLCVSPSCWRGPWMGSWDCFSPAAGPICLMTPVLLHTAPLPWLCNYNRLLQRPRRFY